MKKIIIFLLILLATILFTSCTTQQRVVYRDCDCLTNRYDYWNRYSQGGWGNPFWGWNNPFWGGWNSWNFYPYRVLPRYYIQPNRVQPQQPTRYERRQSVGVRPSRISTDNLYPTRTPSVPRVEVRPSQQNSQPSRVQQRTNQSTPSRIQNNTPSRVQQRTTTPTGNQPTRSRIQNNQ
jgi:hypothetical protein